MTRCHECGINLGEDGGEVVTYLQRDYHYCRECHVGLPRDAMGDVYPRYDMNGDQVLSVYYDGDSSLANGHAILLAAGIDYTRYSTFCCGLCGENYYGDGIMPEDSSEVVCQHCADARCFLSGEGEYYRYQNTNTIRKFIGQPSEHFLAAPTVGIEFEHAPVRIPGRSDTSTEALYDALDFEENRFSFHTDGSIHARSGYSYGEIVSAPASGTELERVIDVFYAPFADGSFTPGPEHPTCGFHMHVESRLLLNIIKSNQRLDANTQSIARKAFTTCMLLCHEFVSQSRRKNTYCIPTVATRGRDTHLRGSDALIASFGHASYPAIAIRTIGTIEFRLWPSSNSIRYTKARAELSQKLIHFIDRCLLDGDNNISPDHEALGAFHALEELCVPAGRSRLVNEMASLLGLSTRCINTLTAMMQRFHPISIGVGAFKFTEKQLSTLTDEDSRMGISALGSDLKAMVQADGDTVHVLEDKNNPMFAFGQTHMQYYPAGDSIPEIVRLAKGEE